MIAKYTNSKKTQKNATNQNKLITDYMTVFYHYFIEQSREYYTFERKYNQEVLS